MDDLIYEEDSYNGRRKYFIQDYVGKKFGRLTVIGRVRNKQVPTWKCECECGNVTYTEAGGIISGTARSCGCLAVENFIKRSTTHGLRRNPLYKIWQSMSSRCFNEHDTSYYNYGERGISVCDAWRYDPTNFIYWAEKNGYKRGLFLDRIDNEGDYCPNNCRFVTPTVSNCNTRMQKNNTTGYIGISPRNNKFCSQVGRRNYLGTFKTKREALEARNNYIIKNNLPHKIQEYRG